MGCAEGGPGEALECVKKRDGASEGASAGDGGHRHMEREQREHCARGESVACPTAHRPPPEDHRAGEHEHRDLQGHQWAEGGCRSKGVAASEGHRRAQLCARHSRDLEPRRRSVLRSLRSRPPAGSPAASRDEAIAEARRLRGRCDNMIYGGDINWAGAADMHTSINWEKDVNIACVVPM